MKISFLIVYLEKQEHMRVVRKGEVIQIIANISVSQVRDEFEELLN